MCDLGIRPILKVGVIIPRGVYNNHILELLALYLLGHSRGTLLALKDAVANFTIITLLKVVHDVVCGCRFSITDLAKY